MKNSMDVDINVVVSETKNGSKYRIVCPYCHETHYHKANLLGWAKSKCGKGSYRLIKKGEE
jgi:hypothetical protein